MSQGQSKEMGHRIFGKWVDTVMFRKIASAGLRVDWMGEQDASRGSGSCNNGEGGGGGN